MKTLVAWSIAGVLTLWGTVRGIEEAARIWIERATR